MDGPIWIIVWIIAIVGFWVSSMIGMWIWAPIALIAFLLFYYAQKDDWAILAVIVIGGPFVAGAAAENIYDHFTAYEVVKKETVIEKKVIVEEPKLPVKLKPTEEEIAIDSIKDENHITKLFNWLNSKPLLNKNKEEGQ